MPSFSSCTIVFLGATASLPATAFCRGSLKAGIIPQMDENVVNDSMGAGNALRRVKFMFPDRCSVYLHDTPADHPFKAVARDFSHGHFRFECRVEVHGVYMTASADFYGRAVDFEDINDRISGLDSIYSTAL